eukprot:c6857_g1_i1 orf=255-1811(-)
MGCIPSRRFQEDTVDANMTSPIKTVVVLFLENRSFDHILGWQKQLNPEIDGVTGQECNPLSTTEPNSPLVYFTDNAENVISDAGHSFEAVREQVFGSGDTSANPPPMNGFAQQAETISPGFSKMVMSGYKPEAVPVLTALVKEFAVFDRWFASAPTSTQPNRLFIHSATSHGLNTTSATKTLAEGLPQRTIFDNLHDAGLTFGIYYQTVPSTLFYRRMRQLKYVNKFLPYEPTFHHHAKEGKLPNYVFIEPRYFSLPHIPANDDHPPNDIAQGQKLIKEVYEILRSSPQWDEVLLLISYDEHGGFYDHVPPPVINVPNPDGMLGTDHSDFKFDQLGVRVPTVLISPWIEKGTVVHRPIGPTPSSEFEHSSIPATLKKLFNLPSGFLTKRDAWAGTFESVLSRSTPRTDCPVTLPDAPEPASVRPDTKTRDSTSRESDGLSDLQGELVLLASHLNGDHILGPNTGKDMSVKDAHGYVEDAVAQFLKASQDAMKTRSKLSSLVSMKPATAGERSFDVVPL